MDTLESTAISLVNCLVCSASYTLNILMAYDTPVSRWTALWTLEQAPVLLTIIKRHITSWHITLITNNDLRLTLPYLVPNVQILIIDFSENLFPKHSLQNIHMIINTIAVWRFCLVDGYFINMRSHNTQTSNHLWVGIKRMKLSEFLYVWSMAIFVVTNVDPTDQHNVNNHNNNDKVQLISELIWTYHYYETLVSCDNISSSVYMYLSVMGNRQCMVYLSDISVTYQ